MKQQVGTYKLFSSIVLFLFLLISHPTSTIAQEVEDEREFDYIKGSEKGPSKWGELNKDWAACKNGSLQSPIDMSNRRVKVIQRSGELQKNYRPCNSTIKNRGHDISIQWHGEKAGSIMINGTEYLLHQCHWHSPSEHTVNGRRYNMELHMVHQSPDPNVANNIAVIGVLYKIGRPDNFLSKLLKNITAMTGQESERNMGVFDPNEIEIHSKNCYRYLGSLTTPPCTEGVIWSINKRVRTVSKYQIKALRDAVHDYAEENARPLQPHNQREIHLYDPSPVGRSN